MSIEHKKGEVEVIENSRIEKLNALWRRRCEKMAVG